MKSVDIGIVGGGQLGRMLIMEGHRLGVRFAVLDPSPDCPASVMTRTLFTAPFNQGEALEKLATLSQRITFEFEHVDAGKLRDLEQKGCRVMPSPETLLVIQDKLRQKEFLESHGLPVPRFRGVNTLADLQQAADVFGYPLMVKSCRGGYDGKGNYLVTTAEALPAVFEAMGSGERGLMAEEGIDFLMEISVLVARDEWGRMETFPVGQNDHRNNILYRTIVPAPLTQEVLTAAKELAMSTMEQMKGVGVFCIEMFVDKSKNLLINEIAPRTHNSGHHTIESCNISQFGQQLRALMGWPLMKPLLRKPAVMINLLGDETKVGKPTLQGLREAMKLGEVYPHLYGKGESRPGRKMGHVTVLADSVEEALATAHQVETVLAIKVTEDQEVDR